MRTNRKKGFTITELVIVIAVIAVLAAVLIPTFASVVSSANESKALQNCHNALTSYRATDGHADVDPGLVLVNNEDGNMYAYVYLGGTLQKIDKIDKISYMEKDGHMSGKAPSAIEFDKGESEEEKFTHQEANLLCPAIQYKKDEEKEEPTSSEKIDLKEQKSGEEVLRGEQNLYFYELELDDTKYVGYFTLEKSESTRKNTLEDGAVIFSDQYGYIPIRDEGSKIVFSDEVPDTGTAGAQAGAGSGS